MFRNAHFSNQFCVTSLSKLILFQQLSNLDTIQMNKSNNPLKIYDSKVLLDYSHLFHTKYVTRVSGDKFSIPLPFF